MLGAAEVLRTADDGAAATWFLVIGPRPRYSCHGEFGSARSSCPSCSDVISVRFLVNIARRAASNCTPMTGPAALRPVGDQQDRSCAVRRRRSRRHACGSTHGARGAADERARGKSQTAVPARANHHQHAAQFATAVSNWRSADCWLRSRWRLSCRCLWPRRLWSWWLSRLSLCRWLRLRWLRRWLLSRMGWPNLHPIKNC